MLHLNTFVFFDKNVAETDVLTEDGGNALPTKGR